MPAARHTPAGDHLRVFRYALALGVSLEEAKRRIATARHDAAVARLAGKGWRG